MMRQTKIFSWLATTVICSFLLVAGCAQPTEETVKAKVELEKQMPEAAIPKAVTLALKFTPQDSTTYKVTAQTEMSLKFEGSLSKDAAFEDRLNDDGIEMTFTQQIQSVDDEGSAVAKITIKELKYFSIYRNNPVLDFDSSREEDRNNPLAKLIGQSYTIKIAPTGKVIEVIDVKQAAVKGRTSAHEAALRLLKPDVIKKLHTISGLPDADKSQLCTGENWSSIKTFPFPIIGQESYERIYTLKEIKYTDGRQIAIVEMDAIPTSEMAEQLHKEQAASIFSKMLDNTRTYTGRLKLDLTTGKVEECFEKLQSEWLMVDPGAGQKDDKEPDAFRMGAVRLYKLEKID